ncbi:hypothetical protein M595_3766 [Lyngbya aestuarii BL J]|uniref:Uncharacterized protein n=1 Tax=Lyngbya aestuarii BL J TaxID=1348334 RepID=U7QIN3_9CYAN|nr:hypothetical protein [Lyngbya aestuarii]ERT06291.1 hypothetical protein M595_3766 [Lyngbya aestuarii BL J]
MDLKFYSHSIFATLATTILSLIVVPEMSLATPVKTPLLQRESSQVNFRGQTPSATEAGAEYIVYMQDKNDQVRGLVYIQNSDIGACFQGNYQSATRQIENLTYAYPVMGDEEVKGWEMNVSNQSLDVEDYSHTFTANQISEGAQDWFNHCVELFN